MYHNFLIHLSTNGHLGCFHVLVIVSIAAMNIGIHMSLSILVSLVCMPRGGIAGLYGSSISTKTPAAVFVKTATQFVGQFGKIVTIVSYKLCA